MSKIVVKKRVSLEFLGDEYKDAYLDFESIPMRDYEGLVSASLALQDDASKSLGFIQEQVVNRFIGGKFPSGDKLEDVSKDDLLDFPGEVFVQAMQQLTGQVSPKV